MPEAITSVDDLTHLLLSRFRSAGHAQVEGYNRFEYVRHTDRTVTILREKGSEERVSLTKLRNAVAAVRSDPTLD